ncbi:hypothetical protein [Methylobacterium sp. J-068]|uniref:hypothetical protein n=1 Tax=Methylobacterium sp. J-068 TaxID=2836649 RepID=UPI001FB97557|nr:hypothetical protein [Methylobacterium sp. J-068]MCJ2034646.1 hypothetical protein [Methylobacterium sp. J-068]
MKNPSRSGLIKGLAMALALVGAMLFGAPRDAQAAPAIASAQVAANAPASGITDVQYGGGHWRHHRHHGRRFHHHHRGHHFGHHHHRRHFGRHFGHRHGHHFGHRRHRY